MRWPVASTNKVSLPEQLVCIRQAPKPQLELNFIEFVVLPLWKSVAQAFPIFEARVTQMLQARHIYASHARHTCATIPPTPSTPSTPRSSRFHPTPRPFLHGLHVHARSHVHACLGVASPRAWRGHENIVSFSCHTG